VLQALMLQSALAKESGFEISKADWIKYQAQTQELSDEELEGVAGGGLRGVGGGYTGDGCFC